MTPIDLRSDTVTKPSEPMREAMARAEVGDDVYGEDPTVNALQERAAELLEKDAAIFVPSGTMANQIAIRCHTQPGDAMIVGHSAHTYLYESGGAAAISGVQTCVVGSDGLFGAEDLRAALFPIDPHYAVSKLVCVENTHNTSGGRVFPLQRQREIAEVAREAGLALHLDGARLFNAVIATGETAAALAAPFDSACFCLSKGLGAPVGSLLCGSRPFIERAQRFRKMFGGGMRQAGILAAAGLYALEHHRDELRTDHENAVDLANGLSELRGIRVDPRPQTNIVRFEVDASVTGGGEGLVERMGSRGLLIGDLAPNVLRAVLHRDVAAAQVPRAVEIVAASLD